MESADGFVDQKEKDPLANCKLSIRLSIAARLRRGTVEKNGVVSWLLATMTHFWR